jgi:hypothetical protein
MHALSVAAEENPWVSIFDESGKACDRFNVGDKVNITTYSNPIYGDYTIEVTDPTDVVKFFHTVSGGGRYTIILANITDELGLWTVEVGPINAHYATGYYQVIPEAPLGVAGALAACFACFGLNKLRPTKKEKE